MVYFITGEIQSGKSTYLLSLYYKYQIGDGFYNRRIYRDSIDIGQEMIRLSTGASCHFSAQINYKPKDWDEIYSFSNYSFSKDGIDFVEKILVEELQNTEPFYIDEIGPLELMDKGLSQAFNKLLQTSKDIYAVVRNRCLCEVIQKFKIKEYRILR
jgi:Predicted nucleotide kinase